MERLFDKVAKLYEATGEVLEDQTITVEDQRRCVALQVVLEGLFGLDDEESEVEELESETADETAENAGNTELDLKPKSDTITGEAFAPAEKPATEAEPGTDPAEDKPEEKTADTVVGEAFAPSEGDEPKAEPKVDPEGESKAKDPAAEDEPKDEPEAESEDELEAEAEKPAKGADEPKA